MELVLYCYDSILLYFNVWCVLDYRYLAYKVGVYVCSRLVEQMDKYERSVFHIYRDVGIVADPDVADVRTERVAYGGIAFSEKDIIPEIHEPAVRVADRVGTCVVYEYTVKTEEVLREIVFDEGLCRPAVLNAEVEAAFVFLDESVFISLIAPLVVPLVAKSDFPCRLPEFDA